ncbi:MAG: N-ethylmaleimide reductase [Halioglobus sp.]|jgi:N-ethylmaleimide reductase
MDLFSPLKLGALEMRNRIVMAPMTRSRADVNAVPTDVMAEYYRQRAGAGLIVSEGIGPSADGIGYCRTSGIYNDAQIAAWKKVLDEVHAEGGLMAAQLMHVGRVSNILNKPKGSETVAPSAITARGEMYTDAAAMQPLDDPRALSTQEVVQVVEEYRQAARNSIDAGFDAVELHCTSGYLPAQFLSTGSNQRDDEYGGSVENRARFALDVLKVICAEAGSDRVGFRICPDNPFNDLSDENPQETFDYFLDKASDLDLAYLHVIRFAKGRVDNIKLGQRHFADRLIVNESYDFEEGQAVVAAGQASAVSYGRHFIGNPDLVDRWKSGAELARFDLSAMYTPGETGYTDYPKAVG